MNIGCRNDDVEYECRRGAAQPETAHRRTTCGCAAGRIAIRTAEGGRGDLIILDAERPEAGPIATVKLPIRAVPQIHGWWVPEDQLVV